MVPSSMTKEQTMSPLRARMIEDMKLAGLAATTQEIYLQAVRSLAKYYNRSPELLAEEEVRRYLLDVRERNARGNPTIAIADGAPCAMRKSAADVDRRMRFLHRFGPGDHRIEIDEFAVIFRSLLRPDFLHRLNRFAHPLEAGRIDGAVVFHFVLVPATPDSEQEPSLARLVVRGDQLGGLDRVALLNERHAGTEFDAFRSMSGCGQNNKRIHRVVVWLG